MQKLYIKSVVRKVKESPEYFFNRLYNCDWGFPATYKDKECVILQCKQGAARSFSDLYKIMRTYYPRITHKHLIKIINEKCTRNTRFNLIYCPHVQKIVLYIGQWIGNSIYLFNRTYYDYNNYLSDDNIEKIDKFTITYLYKKLGYTTKEIKTELKKLK